MIDYSIYIYLSPQLDGPQAGKNLSGEVIITLISMIMIMINMTLIKYRWMRTRRRKETFLRLLPTSRSFLRWALWDLLGENDDGLDGED